MSNRRPCQFFLRGSCRFGNNCRDYHPKGALFEDNSVSNNNNNVGIFNPFTKNQDSINKPNNLNNNKINGSNTNHVLQTLELIGVVINSGVWPFGKIGLLNQTPLFTSLDLNFEEYRWKFYQNNPSNWNNLYLETLQLLSQSYRNFIEQGKMHGYLPANHNLYNLDLSLYSKIGNLYLPNLGKDFRNNNKTNDLFFKPENKSNVTFMENPFNNYNNISSNTGVIDVFNNNNQINNNSSLFVNSFNNNNNVNNNIDLDIKKDIDVNVENTLNSTSRSSNQNFDFVDKKKYSFHNPDVDDDIYQQELLSWEQDAFKNTFFEKNRIPEKVPPKSLRI